MNTHGICHSYIRNRSSGSNACEHSSDSDFCHFLRDPEPTEVSELYGSSPTEQFSETFKILKKLSSAIKGLPDWNDPLAIGIKKWENNLIPSGYTYLAQLVAHDVVQTSLSANFESADSDSFENLRSARLDLDTLYGSHPSMCPFAYKVPKTEGQNRTKLALGPIRKAGLLEWTGPQKMRDIGRTTSINPRIFAMFRPFLTEPMIADGRNDNNAIISQLITIFIHLHNAVFDGVMQSVATKKHETKAAHSERVFQLTRNIVARTYRNVVRNDLLKRILHPTVYTHYDVESPVFLGPPDEDRISLEFSQAYRFGHSMIRPSYQITGEDAPKQIEAVLEFTSTSSPGAMPFDNSWVADWALFFDLSETKKPPNLSRRIGPFLVADLNPVTGVPDTGEFVPKSLGHRDLLRGATIGIWSVNGLTAALKEEVEEIIVQSKLCSDPTYRETTIRQWLKDSLVTFSHEEATAIAKDPPLVFFILLESAREYGGKHLGVLGSLIVGDTLFRLLEKCKEADANSPEIDALSIEIFNNKTIDTMPDLIRETARLANLKEAKPPFASE